MALPPPKRPIKSKTPIRGHAVPQAQPPPGPKILRVGVLLGDKIIEERLLRSRGPVTFGQSGKNTFSVPSPDLPRTFTLFPYAGGKYMLQFTDAMDGRVSDGGSVWTLQQLKGSGKARKQGEAWIIGIPETARGKIVIGDSTLLFQFVQAPPLSPRPALPHSVRGTFADRIDPYLAVIMAASLLAHGVLWGYCKYLLEEPVPAAADVIPDQFAEVTAQLRPPAPPTPDKGPQPKEEAKEEQKDNEKGKDAEKKSRPKAGGGEEGKSIDERVASAAPLRVLKSLSAKGNGGGVATSDKEGWEDLGKGLNKVGSGDVVASVGTGGQGTHGNGLGDSQVAKGSGGGTVSGPSGPAGGTGVEKVEREVKGGVTPGRIEDIDSGGLDADKVSNTIKNRYLARVRMCYERALKTNPNLGGKVTVNFTIGIAGNVVKASADGFDEGVDRCIEQEARGWRFDKPESPATFEYPFILRKLN